MKGSSKTHWHANDRVRGTNRQAMRVGTHQSEAQRLVGGKSAGGRCCGAELAVGEGRQSAVSVRKGYVDCISLRDDSRLVPCRTIPGRGPPCPGRSRRDARR